MAKRQLTGPYSKVTNKNVFPILPLRAQLLAAATNVTVYETVDLRLTPHENMVMDIMKIETWVAPEGYDETTGDGSAVIHVACLDRVDATPNLDTEANFETDASIFYYSRSRFIHSVGGGALNKLVNVDHHHVEYYTEPWTVAKNVAWAAEYVNGTAFVLTATVRAIIWGRIRTHVSDAEYRDIWERQVG